MSKVKYYCIKNKEGDYWNNEFGWMTCEGSFDEAPYSIFTEKEKKIYNLPVEGKWKRYN